MQSTAPKQIWYFPWY